MPEGARPPPWCGFRLKMLDFGLKMLDFGLKMMDFVLTGEEQWGEALSGDLYLK